MARFIKYSIALVFFFLSFIGFSKTIYVSVYGDDSGTGTKQNPFASIQKGLDITFAGDTLMILEGGYYPKDQVRVKHSGTKDKWVVIMGEPGKRVGIAGGAYLSEKPEGHLWLREGMFHIQNVRYVKVENIIINDSHNVAFMIYGQGYREGDVVREYDNTVTHNIILNKCKTFSSYGSGIGIWYSDSVTITNCEVVGANLQAIRPIGQPWRREAPEEAISIAGSSAFEVAYNHVHKNGKEGIDAKEWSSNGTIHHNYVHDNNRVGIYVDSWFALQQNVEVYANIIHDNAWGVCISSEGVGSSMKNIRIHNNLIYNNRHSGIIIAPLGTDENRSYIYLYNNTIVGNSVPAHWAGKGGGIDYRSDNIKHIYAFNNILHSNTGFEIATFIKPEEYKSVAKAKTIVFKNNMISETHDLPSPDGFFGAIYPIADKHSITDDPQFINKNINDYMLDDQSPAKGKSIEINGFGREGVDLGANINMLPNLNSFRY